MEWASMFISTCSEEHQTPENLGGKGFGLWSMTKQGVSVPPALIIPTSVCLEYQTAPLCTMAEISLNLGFVKEYFLAKFGYMPLLAVRSGARASMPGMMDTILNVGLDNSTFPQWAERLGYECATDCKTRLTQMYQSVVCGGEDQDLPNADRQLIESIEAVFKSWNNPRAKVYRELNNIPDSLGTAVVLQAMVFGNLGDTSASGVLFTRNPDTGENTVTGEYLVNAQGEDVVSGTHTPLPLGDMELWSPALYAELLGQAKALEFMYKDVQDVEFTIQEGALYILQTRNAKRTPRAAMRIALDLIKEGVHTVESGLKLLTSADYAHSMVPEIAPNTTATVIGTGIPACSGIVTGTVRFDLGYITAHPKESTILVSVETTPDDIAAMSSAAGVLTMQGGATSHAAVVARGMNRTCVVGLLSELGSFSEGDVISIDGSTGKVYQGAVVVIQGTSFDAELSALMRTQNIHFVSRGASPHTGILDVSGLLANYPAILTKVRKVVESAGSCILNVHPTSSPQRRTYLLFGGATKLVWSVITRLAEDFSDNLSALTFITSLEVPAGCGRLNQPTSLEELVMSVGEVALPLPVDTTPAMTKVVSLLGTTITPVSLGEVATGTKSYVTAPQLFSQMGR